MKNIKYIISLVVLAIFLVGCEAEKPSQDPEGIVGTDTYPTPTFTRTSGQLTSNEKNEVVIVYDIELDRPIDRPIDFYWEVLDSNATLHDDYDIEGGTVAAYSTTGQMTITIYSDGIPESTENVLLTIKSGPSLANQYLVNPNTHYPTINVEIENWDVCAWTLYTSDTYGDGWNGGYIAVDINGTITEYQEDDDHPDTFEILIDNGAAYSFTYVSGGGTGGGPGWESENYYLLTAPDGTTWEDGTMDYSGIPTPGLITSGTNDCP